MFYLKCIDRLNDIVWKKSAYLYNVVELKIIDKAQSNNVSKYLYSSLNLVLVAFFCILALVAFSYSNYFVDATRGGIDNINQSYVMNSSVLNSVSNDNIAQNHARCNCVIFRMDDIQDYWLNSVQNEIMSVFLNHNKTLSLGLIMHVVGNDSKLVQKVEEGLSKGLFELDLHGWNHIDYTKLSEKEQMDSLSKANEKMHKLFGKNSSIFIPPLSLFDNNTLDAMADLKLNILSSDIPTETKIYQNKSIFVAQGNSYNKSYYGSTILNDTKIYHIPATVFFKDFQHGQWIKTPINEIIKQATENIARYGYAVIVLHPQDFALFTGKNGTSEITYINSIDRKETSDLLKVLDNLSSNNIRIKGFAEIINEYR